jgi:hypothetical protein
VPYEDPAARNTVEKTALEEARTAIPQAKRATIVYRIIDDMELTGADYLLHPLRGLRDRVPDPPRTHIEEDIRAIRETMSAVDRLKDRAPPRSFVMARARYLSRLEVVNRRLERLRARRRQYRCNARLNEAALAS